MTDDEHFEAYVSSKLANLGFEHDEGTTGMVVGIVAEESFEPEDKMAAIAGALALDDEEVDTSRGIQSLLDDIQGFRAEQISKMNAAEELKAAEEAAKAQSRSTKPALTPEEEAARRQKLINSYGLVEEEDEKEKAAKVESEKVPCAVFVDPKLLTKKARKKAEADVDIYMQPNLNAAIVRGAELKRRQEDASKALAKREKDKNDLRKQKENAEKAAEEKRKKAQKQERRA